MRTCSWAFGKSQVSEPTSLACPLPCRWSSGSTVSTTRPRQRVVHRPPTNSSCDVSLRKPRTHDWDGDSVDVAVGVEALERTPGSSTPGGKGFEWAAITAPMPAAARNAAAQAATFRLLRI